MSGPVERLERQVRELQDVCAFQARALASFMARVDRGGLPNSQTDRMLRQIARGFPVNMDLPRAQRAGSDG